MGQTLNPATLNVLMGYLKMQLDKPDWLCTNCVKEVKMSDVCPGCGRNHVVIIPEDLARNLMNYLVLQLRLEDKYLFGFTLSEEELKELEQTYGTKPTKNNSMG